MFDLDQKIIAWRAEMLAAGPIRTDELEELEAHLRDEFQQSVDLGITAATAFDCAIQQIGESRSVSKEFAKADRQRRSWFSNPAGLNLLALWFVVAGLNALIPFLEYAAQIHHAVVNWKVSILFGLWFILCCQILIGIGLVRRKAFARACALNWAKWSLAFSLIFIVYFASRPSYNLLLSGSSLGFVFKTGGQNGAVYFFAGLPLSPIFVPILSLMNMAFLLGGIFFLNRPAVRHLFLKEQS